jgi:serine/threonine protein kinase
MVAIKEYYPEQFGARDASSMRVRPKSDLQRETFEWGKARFLQEARTLARFRHPTIVRVARVFEALGTAYMVMDFEHGLPLESWLQRLKRPPTQQELDQIVRPVLDALEIMHASNVLHRDIAPDNIIMRTNGTPVLLDFGAARSAIAEKSQTLTGIVKPGYSPLEQYVSDGRSQGPWSDIYALGATLYRAVVGQPPNEAPMRENERGLGVARYAKGLYRPEFLAAIESCLSVRYSERPQSVAALRRQFFCVGSVTSGAAIKHSPFEESRPTGSVARPIVSNASAPRWIAIAAVVATIATFGSYQYNNHDRNGSNVASLVAVNQGIGQKKPIEQGELSEVGTKRTADAAVPEKNTDEPAEINREPGPRAETRPREEQQTKEQPAAAAAKKNEDETRAREERAAIKEAGTGPDARPTTPPLLSSQSQLAGFDGRWRSEWRAIRNCRDQSHVGYLVIKNGRLSGGGVKSGTVRPDGTINYSRQGQLGMAVLFSGKLVGEQGSASSHGGGGCIGRTTLTRVAG